jgi:hypothetical protein
VNIQNELSYSDDDTIPRQLLDFSKTKLLTKFKKVIDNYYVREKIKPYVQKLPDWSQEFRKKHSKKYPLTLTTSKLLYCLARGVCSQYLITGLESQLRDQIYGAKNYSLTPEVLLDMALVLSKGNVSFALLTIENVLSRYWLSDNRNELQLTRKLMPIKSAKKDNFGHWYHLFGIMLYGFEKNAYSASLVGGVEQVGSVVLSGFKDRDSLERKINLQGGFIGEGVYRYVKKLPNL